MKRAIQGIKKYIEPLFILSVFILVVLEFKSLSKEISYDKLTAVLQGISPFIVILLLLAGIVSVLPMLEYEVILNRLIDGKHEKRYLYETSFTINTMNNLIGFGGIINMGLRNYYYGDKKNKVELLKVILETHIYHLIGVSILSAMGLFYMALSRDTAVTSYAPWLIGGVLYSPIVILFSNRKQGEGKRVPLWAQARLALTSFLEWGGAYCLFLFIGKCMGVEFHVAQVLTVLVSASIIGMVSMIPGSLGSFDLMTLVGLGNLGVGYETVLAWLLLYRVCYYVVPFLIGLYFFIKHFGHSFNEENDGIPAEFLKSIGHDICSLMMYLFGIFMILSATIPDQVSTIKWLAKLNPIHANILYQFPSILLGLVFILLGRLNIENQKRSFKPTMIFLAITFFYAMLTGFGVITYAYLILLTILTISTRKDLYRTQFVYRAESLTMDLCIALFFGMLYLLSIASKAKGMRLILRAKDFIVIPFEENWLRISLLIVISAAVLYTILYYVRGKGETVGEAPDLDRVRHLLETYGGDLDAGLVFLGDKQLYWYTVDGEDRCAIQLKTEADNVIVMGEPMGNPEDVDDCIREFIRHVDVLGYDLVFYEVSRDFIMKLHDFGFHFMKFGEAALVNLDEFTMEGRNRRSARNVLNKFEKEGYSFKISEPPFDDKTMKTFKAISDQWLGNRGEKGFSLGFFDEDYLNRGPVAVVENEEGSIVSFANLMPVYKKGYATIDLMRHDPETSPNGTMDFLFLNLFLYFKEQGMHWFDLGMAPLANVGINEHSFLQEKLAYFVFKFGGNIYSFEGLRTYKSKYATRWDAKYTGYNHRANLFFTVVSLVRVDRRPPKKEI